MQLRVLCAGILLFAAGSAFGQQPTAKSSAGSKKPGNAADQVDVPALLESNVRAAWAAFKNKNKRAYSDFLWDDFMAVEEDGDGERNKLKVVREVDQSVVHDFSLQLFKVDPIGPDAALVTYESSITFPPRSANRYERIFVSEIWLKRNGQWKAWRYQATRVR